MLRSCSALGLPLVFAFLLACGDSTAEDSSKPLPQPSGGSGGSGAAGGEGGVGATGAAGGEGGVGATGAAGGEGGVGAVGGAGGAGAAGGAGGEGAGGNGEGACDSAGPVVEQAGAPTRRILRGTVITPTGPLEGEVLVDGTTITCVSASCASATGAAGATIIETNGVIAPGMIDGHNHILFDIFDGDDWSPMQTYMNHNQWPNEARYSAMVDAKQWMEGQGASPVDLKCEMNKYGELKALIAGTTSVQASGGTGNCYGSLARTLGISANDLPDDNMQTSTLYPDNDAADIACENIASGETTAYVVHVAEGVDMSARNEFDNLNTVSTVDGCLYSEHTVIIHGTALDPSRLAIMGDNDMSLVWSPRSNVFLYGGGTDYSKTTDIPTALGEGIRVAIAPDWSMGGSQNMLDELRYADEVDNAEWGDILTPRELVEMATLVPANMFYLDDYIGSIAVGKRADIAVYLPLEADPYESILAASPREVTLVMVDGRILYGDADLDALAPANGVVEPLDVCCRSKFLAIAETTTANELNQTYADFEAALSAGLLSYDALDLTQWNFAPLTPIIKCP